MSNNQYGRFFYKRLNLPLYESRPKEWREVQLKVVHHFYGPKTAVGEAAVRATKADAAEVEASTANDSAMADVKPEENGATVAVEEDGVKPVKKEKKEKKDKKSKKRTRDSEDEIDDLFADVVGDKKKKKKKSKQD